MSYYRCADCGLGMASAVALAAGDRCPRCATELVPGESPGVLSIARRFARGAAGSEEVAAEGSLDGFALTSRVVDEVAWIELRGKLDIATAPELERALAAVPPERRALLDLHALDFIDAPGMRAVLSAYRRLGKRLRIIPPPEELQRVFGVVGLEQTLAFERAGIAARHPGLQRPTQQAAWSRSPAFRRLATRPSASVPEERRSQRRTDD